MAHHKFPRIAVFMAIASMVGLIGCQSYPRYSNTETEYEKPTGREREEKQESRQIPQNNLDRTLMARIIDDYLGTPYKKGGTTVDGIDCSNLVRNVYFEMDGRSLPPDARRMFRAGSAVEKNEMAFGDLVFFAFGTRGPSHVGIFIGNSKFVHASETRGVIVSSLDEPTYIEAYLGARRLD